MLKSATQRITEATSKCCANEHKTDNEQFSLSTLLA